MVFTFHTSFGGDPRAQSHFRHFGGPQPEYEPVIGILQKMALRDLVKSHDSIEDGVIVSMVENPLNVKEEQPVENRDVKSSTEPEVAEQTKTENKDFCHEPENITGIPENTNA